MRKFIIALLSCVSILACSSAQEPTNEPNKTELDQQQVEPAGACIQFIQCLRGQGYCCHEHTCVEINGGLGCDVGTTWDRVSCSCR